MSVEIIYFVHGTTTDNEKNISSGWSDVSISELGWKQLEDLKAVIKDENFDTVFCSDLKRAIESANKLFGGKNEIIRDGRLRECNYGDYNGKPSEVVDPLQEKYISTRFPNGESYEDVKARMQNFLMYLKKNYDGKRVAIVAHKAPQLAMDVIIKNITWDEAFAGDWRKKKAWQPGWKYILD